VREPVASGAFATVQADDRMYWDGLEWAEAAVYNGREGDVSFIRGNSDDPGDSADGGAYDLTGVSRGSDGYRFGGNNRVYFSKRTLRVTGS